MLAVDHRWRVASLVEYGASWWGGGRWLVGGWLRDIDPRRTGVCAQLGGRCRHPPACCAMCCRQCVFTAGRSRRRTLPRHAGGCPGAAWSAGGRLACRAAGYGRMRRTGEGDLPAHRTSVRGLCRWRCRRIRARIVSGAQTLRATFARVPRVLHHVAVGALAGLQGHGAAQVFAAAVSGPGACGLAGTCGAVPSTLFHQYAAALAAGASVPLSGA